MPIVVLFNYADALTRAPKGENKSVRNVFMSQQNG
jgi:hypothetical protein